MKEDTEIIKEKPGRGIPNPVGPRLLPLKDAAQVLGLGVWALRRLIWHGQLPVVKFQGGRKMYLDRTDIENFIQRNKVVVR